MNYRSCACMYVVSSLHWADLWLVHNTQLLSTVSLYNSCVQCTEHQLRMTCSWFSDLLPWWRLEPVHSTLQAKCSSQWATCLQWWCTKTKL